MSTPRDRDTSLDSLDTVPHDAATVDATTLPAAPVAGVGGPLLDAIDHARRYRVGARLGVGGMGEVRLVRDELIGREVAFKVIHDERMADADAVQRFLREARVQAQLEHPAIVPIHDVGRTADGRTYFTMKRVRGRTLAEILAALAADDADTRARFSRRKLLTAFVSVCQAVELAHARGVLHRDLKPSNIMFGDFGEVYVLDWGIARLDGAAEASVTPAPTPTLAPPVVATAVGAVIGTPGYMSPEQARGDRAALDGRTDVYALGAILFELLALAPLHPLGHATAALASTLTGVDARPSRRAPTRDIPPELDALCVAATALEPAARLPHVRDLSDAVERFLDGDRDLELRRRLAAEHAAQAGAMAAAAIAADDEVRRSRAMQEVGRALALDADNQAARRAMVQLLTTPPRQLPAEARAAVDASSLATQRFAAWMGVGAYLAWLAAVPIGLWMGVADRGRFALFVLAQVGALAGCAWLALAPRIGGARLAVATLMAWLATASLAWVFGSLVLVPTVAVANTAIVLLQPRARARPLVVAGFAALVVGPLVLELVGVLAPAYRFDGGVMALVPSMVRYPATPALLALVLASLATLGTLAMAVAKIRTMLTDAEERLQLHAWQLRQLVP